MGEDLIMDTMNIHKLRCDSCGQFVGPNGQWGAVAPDDESGDPDYDYAIDVCSVACAEVVMQRTGFQHWFATI